MDPGFRRTNIRLPADQYKGQKRYFVTICCQQRRRVFLDPHAAQWIVQALKTISEKEQFAVHAYCVMPDHLHILTEGRQAGSDLLRFVGSFKHRTGLAYERKEGVHLWQKKFYDYILRNKDSMNSIAWYIWMNPVRKGMCETVQEYPYAGSLSVNVPRTRPIADWTPPWLRNAGSQTTRPAAT